LLHKVNNITHGLYRMKQPPTTLDS